MKDLNYEEFINEILETRGRFNCGEEYYERHHIVPRCMSGSDEENNLIDLFAREHFIAHKLLALENQNNISLVHAWFCMAFASNDYQHRYELSPEEYEEVRIAFSNVMTGRFISEEVRENMKKSAKARCTEEWKEKHSKSQSGIKKPKSSHPCSEDSKNIIGQKNSKAVYQKTLNGLIIGEFISQSDAERITGVAQAAIWRCCNKKQKSAGGYTWDYVDNNNETHNNKMKTVVQLNFNGIYIQEWRCATYAENILGIPRGKITLCCKGKRRSTGGFKWMYKEDYDKLITKQNDCEDEI